MTANSEHIYLTRILIAFFGEEGYLFPFPITGVYLYIEGT
jgi:hypothetical protein